MNRYTLVIGTLLALGVLLFLLITTAQSPLIFSPPQLLGALWNNYKLEDLEPSTLRTLDKSMNNITTSEGESYTMLRAVWMDDKSTFDTSWQWTEDNLQKRPNDKLFAWLFGERPDGSYGILSNENGENTASDADTDIALALTFAYARWQDPAYLTAAQTIVKDIWSEEVITIDGTPYLAADDLEKTASSTEALIDPSYLQPAAYRIFALIDPSDPWSSLVDSSYNILGESMQADLDATSTVDLPPDWLAINKQTGVITAAPAKDSNFGFDALRVPYNLALDYEWYGDSRDLQLLSQMSFLGSTWSNNDLLDTTYSHAGTVVTNYETPAMYGGTLGYFLLEEPATAMKIYNQKIVKNFDAETNSWKMPLSYYDDNWSWFGIGLYNHLLPNLAASLPPSAYQ